MFRALAVLLRGDSIWATTPTLCTYTPTQGDAGDSFGWRSLTVDGVAALMTPNAPRGPARSNLVSGRSSNDRKEEEIHAFGTN
jgi:hypothetical protein